MISYSCTKILLIAAAILVDRVIGDPEACPHPVQLLGWLISQLEQSWNRGSPHARLVKGICLVVLVTVTTAAISWKLEQWLSQTYLGLVLLVWLMSTTLAVNSLRRHALRVYKPLVANDLHTARHYTSYIVGRDTECLNASEIARAVVETVAENTADGITAPMFYLLLFGLPGAMTYKAINTLDSMLGYKNERFLYFGRAAAKLDDVANYLPARLSALLLIPVAWIMHYDAASAWRYLWRDAKEHQSPNSGWLEAGFAGALGVQLGGLNYYQGVAEWRAPLGEARQELSPQHILDSLRLMQGLSYAFAAIGLISLVVIK